MREWSMCANTRLTMRENARRESNKFITPLNRFSILDEPFFVFSVSFPPVFHSQCLFLLRTFCLEAYGVAVVLQCIFLSFTSFHSHLLAWLSEKIEMHITHICFTVKSRGEVYENVMGDHCCILMPICWASTSVVSHHFAFLVARTDRWELVFSSRPCLFFSQRWHSLPIDGNILHAFRILSVFF